MITQVAVQHVQVVQHFIPIQTDVQNENRALTLCETVVTDLQVSVQNSLIFYQSLTAYAAVDKKLGCHKESCSGIVQ